MRSARTDGPPCSPCRSADRKFIEAPEAELYDLAADPGETRNLAVAAAGEAAAWRGRLDGARKRFGAADASASAPMDEEQRERLASLGYVSGPAGAAGAGGDRPDPKRLVAQHNAVLEAQALISAGRLAEARARLEKVLAVDPRNPAAQSLLGTLLFAKGDRDGGLARLEEAARAAPGVYENQRNLANALHVAGRLDESARAWRAAIALRPGSGTDHYALGNVLFAKGDHAGAVVEYTEALRLGPPSAGLHAALGVALASTGKTGKAREELALAVREDPKLAGAWIALGQIDERSLAWDGARRSYARALEADPDSAEALFRHARACLELGRRQEAARSADRLFERHPGYPAAGWLRGRLLLADGDRPGAREALRLYLARPDADPGPLGRRSLPAPVAGIMSAPAR